MTPIALRRGIIAATALLASTAAGATTFLDFFAVGTVTWTAPYSTTYTLSAVGGSGGSGDYHTTAIAGGAAASVFGDFTLNAGDQLFLTVGGRGADADQYYSEAGGGGGGASVIRRSDNYLMLVAAGGGGGGNTPGLVGQAGQAGSNGTSTGTAAPGLSGGGGAGGTPYDDRDGLTQTFFPTTVSSAGGGSGIFTPGGTGAASQANLHISTAQGGSFPSGGTGAAPAGGSGFGGGAGGYGGGGGGDYQFGGGGGGGGGFSGGAGGDSHYYGDFFSGFGSHGYGGGGGGSYIAAGAVNPRAYTGVHTGNGGIVISFDYSPPPPPPPPPPPVPEPSSWMLLLAGFALTGVVSRRRHRVRSRA